MESPRNHNKNSGCSAYHSLYSYETWSLKWKLLRSYFLFTSQFILFTKWTKSQIVAFKTSSHSLNHDDQAMFFAADCNLHISRYLLNPCGMTSKRRQLIAWAGRTRKDFENVTRYSLNPVWQTMEKGVASLNLRNGIRPEALYLYNQRSQSNQKCSCKIKILCFNS